MRNGGHQASYLHNGERYYALRVYDAKMDAEGWLANERRLIELGGWKPPADREAQYRNAQTTVRNYADQWVRERDLAPTTRRLYRNALDTRILPTFGDERLADITPALVRTWWAGLNSNTPTGNSHAYRLLRTIFGTAVGDKLIDENPVRVEGAGKLAQRRELEVLTAAELRAVVDDMPVEYRAATLVLAWCGLRFGELIELRRKDIERADGVPVAVKVRRAASRVDGAIVVGEPKSDAGIRDVAIPPHVGAELAKHMRERVNNGPDSFMFSTRRGGARLTQRAFTLAFKKSAASVGRGDLRVHDLRHTGATLAAQAGATTRDLMDRLGHSTPAMSMRYQHSSAARDAAIATRLSELAGE
ncbi:putative integrase [Gordonia effusa NBRC 100432]|uniref:Putative integrase n=1 Tax=Gordonia effusa NBRC 100432 TaxID=1077974 RepID=H0QZ62_9ACTN|nr:site-specific integrase [Gordonia effusa]GAB18113.1 putative integrase [Gordonia effusa NBRC 100432]